VRMEREDERGLSYDRTGLLDPADAAISVAKGVGEGPSKAFLCFVKRLRRINQPAVCQQLSPRADPRVQGSYEYLVGSKVRQFELDETNSLGGLELDGSGVHTLLVPLSRSRTRVWARGAGGKSSHMGVRQTSRTTLPTKFGIFQLTAFECPSGDACLALTRGSLEDQTEVLTRIHSECLTGDSLGSLRCDCGIQLRAALRAIAAEGRGVVVYVVGHEGRGIGIINKLRAYALQDEGHDTLAANVELGLPIDARQFDEAAEVLRSLGIRSIRLLTNNPLKAASLRTAGTDVVSVHPMEIAAHARNLRYLHTKREYLGHTIADDEPPQLPATAPDSQRLIGEIEPLEHRPYVILKFAQTLDGRIATRSGDARWISSEDERIISHAIRAHCDGILVGHNTVLKDDPQLTVRLVEGSSPTRVVLDSQLSLPVTARLFDSEAPTTVITTPGHDPKKRSLLQAAGIEVISVPPSECGVDLAAALEALRNAGMESLLVEGGASVITSLLKAHLVDRLVVSIAPTILGAGVEAVGELESARVSDAIRLVEGSVHVAGRDLMMAFDLSPAGPVPVTQGEILPEFSAT
jgi:GTP cyclohydrolase II